MIDIDDTDMGMFVLGLIAIACVAAASLSPIQFTNVKEIILVCVAGISGRMGMKGK